MRCLGGLLVMLLMLGAGQTGAVGAGLDPSLQLLKQQALELERDLLILQEQMENPLVIYFSMQASSRFKLQSLHILIDGQVVKTHEYDSNTLQGLKKGGAQRVYAGQLAPGPHELIVYYRNNRDYQRGNKRIIHKTLKPAFLEILIRPTDSLESRSQPELLIQEWDRY